MEWPAHLPIVGGGGVTYTIYLGFDGHGLDHACNFEK